MVDILLIQPPIRDFYLTAKRTLPYGLACVAAALIREGFSVQILDGLATSKSRPIDLPPAMAYLKKYYGRPDRSPWALFHRYRHSGYSILHLGKIARDSGAFLIGISSLFTAYADEALKTAEMVKRFYPQGLIVLGGHHPTAFPAEVIAHKAVDFILRGEGEISLPLLARALKRHTPRDEIARTVPGIVLRQNDGTVHSNPPASLPNLNRAPLPAMHLVKHAFYQRGQGAAWVVSASRGCPMQCSYCCFGAASEVEYRRRSVDSVMAEIEQAVHRHAVGFIDFEDENLSLDKGWFLRLLSGVRQRFKGKRLELRAMNGLFPSSLDEEIVGAMQKAGFKSLNLSLGSTSPAQLQRFGRADVRQAFEASLQWAEKYGLGAVGYVIAGAPGQSPEGSVDDLLFLASRRVLAAVSIFYPAPGSADYNLCQTLNLLPAGFALLRASCLPLAHTTGRRQAATLLRLGRILNFIKSLADRGIALPLPQPFPEEAFIAPGDRFTAGMRLLEWFLHDGKIRGVTPEGVVFEHHTDPDLIRSFIDGLAAITIRGSSQEAPALLRR